MVRQKRERDAAIFSELHRKLQGQTLIKNRWAILYLLMKLSEDKNKPKVSNCIFDLISYHLFSVDDIMVCM